MNNFNYQVAPQASVYVETKAFGLNPLASVGFAAALITGKGPGLSSSALLLSNCPETQLKAAHHALWPKITLHVSYPKHNADYSVLFCAKSPPQTCSVCSYF